MSNGNGLSLVEIETHILGAMAKREKPGLLRTVIGMGVQAMGVIAAIASAAWLLGQPAAVRFVDNVVAEHHFATTAELAPIQKQLDGVASENRTQDILLNSEQNQLSSQDTKLNILIDLVKEGRQDIKDLSRDIRRVQP